MSEDNSQSMQVAQSEVPAEQNQQPQQPVPNPQEDRFAAKFAALTRKEKEIREREKLYSQKEAEYNKKLQEIEEKQKSELGLVNKLKENPLKFMHENGISFEELSQMVLNEGNPTPDMKIKRVQEELDRKYSSQLEELKKQLEEKEKKAQEENVNKEVQKFMNEITDFVNKNDEKYELIRVNDAVQLVYDVIAAYYQQTGEILDNDKAADQVEAYLEEEARKILELKKFKGVQTPKLEQKENKTAPTLSNTLAAEVPVKGEKLLTREESLREAAKLIRWQE